MQGTRVECRYGASTLSLETGKLAKQAHGAVVVRLGDTMVLAAAVEGGIREGSDFFPLHVDYREQTYAAGKFPGGFIKREGRPTTKETLTSRLIDRPIRPLFPADYVNEVQIMATVLSADQENDPDVLCMIGASAALHVSHIPFLQADRRGPRRPGQRRVRRHADASRRLEESDLDLIVAGTRDAITHDRGLRPRDARGGDARGDHVRATSRSSRSSTLIEELRDEGRPGGQGAAAAGRRPTRSRRSAKLRRRVPRTQADRRARRPATTRSTS